MQIAPKLLFCARGEHRHIHCHRLAKAVGEATGAQAGLRASRISPAASRGDVVTKSELERRLPSRPRTAVLVLPGEDGTACHFNSCRELGMGEPDRTAHPCPDHTSAKNGPPAIRPLLPVPKNSAASTSASQRQRMRHKLKSFQIRYLALSVACSAAPEASALSS